MSNIFEIDDEIVEIEYIGEQETIDINTTGNRLFYANGILTHNSAVEEIEFDHSHISGGISKINTADNVFGIFTSRAMRERGRYQLQLMKTRSSSGVGSKIDLDFDIDTLRITNCDDEDPASTTASHIINSVKSRVSMNENGILTQTPESDKISTDVQTKKLDGLLSQIRRNN